MESRFVDSQVCRSKRISFFFFLFFFLFHRIALEGVQLEVNKIYQDSE